MKIQNVFLTLMAVASISAARAVSLTAAGTDIAVNNTDYTVSITNNTLTSPPAASQAGGSYRFSYGGLNGAASVASNNVASPSFSLTFTNNTGVALNSIDLTGVSATLKQHNPSGTIENLAASITGISGYTITSNIAGGVATNLLDIKSINGSTPATGIYSATISGFNLGVNQSFTITWKDTNDSSTDAMFGLANLTVNAKAAAPLLNDTIITVDPSSVNFNRVMVGSTNPAGNVTLHKTGGNAATYTATVSPDSQGVAVSDADGNIDPGTQDEKITVGIDRTTTGSKSGSVTIDNTATTSNDSATQGSADPDKNVSVTGTVVADRQISGNVSVGQVFVDAAVSGTATLTTTGDDNNFTRVTVSGSSATSVTASGTGTVSAGSDTLFNGESVTADREVTGKFTQSGNGQSITVDLGVSGEGIENEQDHATATIQADVYQHASFADGNYNGGFSESPLNNSNNIAYVQNDLNSDGGQRAAAIVTDQKVTGSGWSATPFVNLSNPDSSTPNNIGEFESGGATVSFDSTHKLNGTHIGSLVVSFADPEGIAGGGSLGSKTWTLSEQVSGNVAETGVAYDATVLAGNKYDGLGIAHASGKATEVALLAGTATEDRDVSLTFTSINPGADNDNLRVSDVVDLEGSGNDIIVLQLSYNEADVLAAGFAEGDLRLAWLRSDGTWALAVAGNSGGSAISEGDVAWNENFGLGAYGVDTANNVVWAVVDHNSLYSVAVVTVPEPGTYALLAMAGTVFIVFLRRRAVSKAA